MSREEESTKQMGRNNKKVGNNQGKWAQDLGVETFMKRVANRIKGWREALMMRIEKNSLDFIAEG